MGAFEDLRTLDQAQRVPRAPAKGLPHMLEKKARKVSKEEQAKAFRDEIWRLDQGRSRATGKPLKRSGTIDWSALGEVDHSIPRSLAPERLYDVSNGLLLSKEENRLRKVPCPRAPEYRVFDYTGPDDRRQPQTFVWRDADGKVTKRRIG